MHTDLHVTSGFECGTVVRHKHRQMMDGCTDAFTALTSHTFTGNVYDWIASPKGRAESIKKVHYLLSAVTRAVAVLVAAAAATAAASVVAVAVESQC
jgi:hypothetical protein